MSSQQALMDFLIYSYFKIIPKAIYGDSREPDYSTYRIKKAIMKAYEDATNEGAYNTLFKKTIEAEKLKQLKSASERAKNDSAEFLFSQIQKLSALASNYKEWHKNTCEGLRKKYSKVCLNENEPFFTYGNAQKWVNMTMKYLWLLGRLPEGLTAKSLHVPIDSFILEKLREENVDEIRRDGDTYKYKGKSWSQLDDYDVYLDIQTKIGQIAEKAFPIEWEGPAWTKVAQQRNEKEETRKKIKNK